jgi:hypothetical protein
MAFMVAALPYIYAAGVAASAYGVYEQSRAQAQANRANANAADYNAKLATQNAAIARANAGSREDQLREQQRQFLARQRAAAAESGFDPGTGTLGLVQEQSADRAELDALMVRYGGELDARGYGNQATLDAYQGGVLRTQAGNARRAGNIGAGASLLMNAASAYTSYQNFKLNGGGGAG